VSHGFLTLITEYSTRTLTKRREKREKRKEKTTKSQKAPKRKRECTYHQLCNEQEKKRGGEHREVREREAIAKSPTPIKDRLLSLFPHSALIFL